MRNTTLNFNFISSFQKLENLKTSGLIQSQIAPFDFISTNPKLKKISFPNLAATEEGEVVLKNFARKNRTILLNLISNQNT